MTIYNIGIDSGYPVKAGVDSETLFREAVNCPGAVWTVLPEGTFEITPPGCVENHCRHVVTVFDTGKAKYYVLPNDAGSELHEKQPGEEVVGDSVRVRIPEDQSAVIITGPANGSETDRILSVLFHRPGPNPKVLRRI